jgi:putative methyltransferase (TIGR04325 family)
LISFRSFAKDFCPPILFRALRSLWPRYGLIGDYQNWEAAVAAAAPYEPPISLFAAGVENIRSGECKPGTTFFPILAGILLAGDRVRVLDFGGGPGISYLLIDRVIPARIKWWRIVELPPVVEWGRTHLADDKLAFFTSINGALNDETPDVVLCGGVLQYIENPYSTLAELLTTQPHILILDRTPVYRRERFIVQRVPPQDGGASLAYRILAEDELDRVIKDYELIGEHYLGTPDPMLTKERYIARVYRRNSK